MNDAWKDRILSSGVDNEITGHKYPTFGKFGVLGKK
jgi:hypothetical protein